MLIKLIVANIIIVFVGYGPVRFAFKDSRLPLYASLCFSFGIGVGLITLWMFLLQILGINWSIGVITYPLLLPTIIYTIKSSYSPRRLIEKNPQGSSLAIENVITVLVFSYVIFMISTTTIRALLSPLYYWDALSTIGYKGKIFFYQKGLGQLAFLPHHAYPLHVPLSLVWEALWLGEWHDALIKIIFPLCYAALLGVHYFFLRNYTSRLWAILGVGLLASSGFLAVHAKSGYRDLFVGYYNYTAIILILLSFSTKNKRLLLLAGLFSGLTSWTKLEGSCYVMIHIFLVLFLSLKDDQKRFFQKAAQLLWFILPVIIICGGYHGIKWLLGLQGAEGKIKFLLDGQIFHRGLETLKNFGNILFFSPNWSLSGLLLLLSLWKARKKDLPIEVTYVTLAFLLNLSLIFMFSILTKSFIYFGGKYYSIAFPRIIIHFFAIIPVLIILINAPRRSTSSP